MFALVLLSVIKDSVDYIYFYDINRFHREKLAIFVALLASFITNAFSASHLIKLFMLFSASVKIMRCTFLVQNNGYYLILER